MPQISEENLTRILRIPAKAPLRAGAAAHRFRPSSEFTVAVDSIGVSIESGESAAGYPTLLLLDKMSQPPHGHGDAA